MKSVDKFINTNITKRDKSFFLTDIEKFDIRLESSIKNKSVLVVGGAGSIGSSFIKSVLKFKPSKLVVVDTNENGLTELTRDLRSSDSQYVPKNYFTYPMDFSSKVFERMFMSHKPFHIVANFAAHKHVRSEKDIFSIEAMIKNNVIKAKFLLDLLKKNKPEHFFCVSTDKASNPVNIMGASKKLMEKLIMSYKKEFKITTARFANVAFSNGSLLSGFIERINKNQPISCPVDVKRFFVSAEESGHICMIACILGNSGDIFFPKLNKSNLINFKDIAISYLEYFNRKIIICKSENEAKILSKDLYKPDSCHPVYFFKSDTSGEKLFEEFYDSDDVTDFKTFDSLGVIINSKSQFTLNAENMINEFLDLFAKENCSKNNIVELLSKYISDFRHLETGKNLDQKM